MVDLSSTMVDLPNTMVDLPYTMVDLPNTMVVFSLPFFCFPPRFSPILPDSSNSFQFILKILYEEFGTDSVGLIYIVLINGISLQWTRGGRYSVQPILMDNFLRFWLISPIY